MNISIKESSFYNFLIENFEKGQFTNDDVVAIVLPLLKTIRDIHANGKVSSIDDISSIYVEDEKLNILSNHKDVKTNLGELSKILPNLNQTFEVTEVYTQNVEIGDDIKQEYINNSVESKVEKSLKIPIYLVNYDCYELKFDHHDPLTDIFILGMILGSIALNFDFTDEEDLKQFVDYRKSMVFLNSKIHPAIANIILGMTELDRRKRWKDLGEIIEKLKNYRDYNPENEYDLTDLLDAKTKGKSQFIHEKLRNRLFDNSRRNRLLYYKSNLKFLNLTISSVPQVLNYQNINPESIFFWNHEVSQKIISGSSISLNKYLRIEDNPYITPTLDKIRLESSRDINEYGFSQLKLVLCFLNWYNTKENSREKIQSPLLLASVKLSKKKGVKDQYTIEFVDSEIEVNPVLSNFLKELYGIRLPETLQLSDTKIEDIYQLLKNQIEQNSSGITLDYISKPKIKLIHTLAKQTRNQFDRRSKKRRVVSDIRSLTYSYENENFQPYGLELFKNYVLTHASDLEYLINNDIKLAPNHFQDEKIIERDFYTLDEGSNNPFMWEFDTCNMVLGNFNYKKMSLVRDYNLIMDQNTESVVFNNLFNSLPQREFVTKINTDNTFTKTFNVVASDPTQNKAVAYSEAGESYVIQGPPGTGKSQTIANLIANYVANNKKILFICEKRAALDVVFHRLKNQGLDDLCCLIHDSQADKKEFILNLKETFNRFTTSPSLFNESVEQRNNIVSKIENEIAKINDFHQFMKTPIHSENKTLLNIFEELVENPYKPTISELNELNDEIGYADWSNHQQLYNQLQQINQDTNNTPYFSLHPFRYFQLNVFTNYQTQQEFIQLLEKVSLQVEEFSEKADFFTFPSELNTFEGFSFELQKLVKLVPFFEKGIQELLRENTALYLQLDKDIAEIYKLNSEIDSLKGHFPYWNAEISEMDVNNALGIIQQNETRFFRFLNGAFRNAKKQILSIYSLEKHTIKPTLTQLLLNKSQQIALQNKIKVFQSDRTSTYKWHDLKELKTKVKEVQPIVTQQTFDFLGELNSSQFTDIYDLNQLLQNIEIQLNANFIGYGPLPLNELLDILNQCVSNRNHFSIYASIFQELQTLNKSILDLLRSKKLLPLELKSIILEKTLHTYFSKNYDHKKFNMDVLHLSISRIKEYYKSLLEINGKYIIENQKDNLRLLMLKSEQSVAGKAEIEKQLKKNVTEGRKILENEFTKTMRYKSIRELATAESGIIVREIKPVWLMSPLSVSDTLPINDSYFDVVIFDEASQITVEEGIPPLYRAKQTIVVGDEMQMPPSNFFGSSAGNEDDLWLDEEEGENEYFSLDADSFLTQGARKFPSLMLGWHYRSKHESLIGFSNASFYNNNLLTIPDVKDHINQNNEIVVENNSDAEKNIEYVHARPISYHYIKEGVYSARSNEKEAQYIAHLVRSLLNEKSGSSIGIVAFSMEQQNEIESAISDLCISDKEFESSIEEEYKRIEDNQFVGIFVKNLENVQGDERDIIIMSTCYGYDPKGKMLMNFGPINKRGGEKRLNVIFSRAKKSMCVVSSIKYHDIKNEYNEGANYFRRYLQYAELVSLGQIEAANTILNVIGKATIKNHVSEIILSIKKELELLGFVVQQNIGQSKFKCHIAIKKTDIDKNFSLGIIVDDGLHYQNDDILEQYLLKPEVMKQNGWKICQVYSKDWFEDKNRVLQMIQKVINEEPYFEEVSIEESEFSDLSKTIESKDEVMETVSIESPLENIPLVNEIEKIEEESVLNSTFQRFIYTLEGSNKFWEICSDKNEIIVQYGRIGTKGQRMVKAFENVEKAKVEMNKLIHQKTSKGYVKDK